jgi:tRNA A37 threonylcarbamoyladenosine dehydratase
MHHTDSAPPAAADAPLWERSAILLSEHDIERLRNAHIFLAGLGGVGSFVAEGLARAGVGRLTLADFDHVAPSNLNRQLVALHSTLGQKKAQVMAARINDINPACEVTLIERFLAAEEMPELMQTPYSYVIDAIDSLNSKVALLEAAQRQGLPVASSMGAGGRLDPGKLVIGDLMQSEVCPLARVVRRRLRKRGVGAGVLAVWSTEEPRPPLPPEPVAQGRARAVNGTLSYMPALFGLTLCGAVIQRLLEQQ